ncbi:MAG: hypothetical protein AABY84_13275 [Candidatus Firestonebacteria bacterium]
MRSNILRLKKDDIKTIQGFIALYDILGYSPWIKENDLSTVVIDHKNMNEMIRVNTENRINNWPDKPNTLTIKVYNYADTFLIYTNEISDISFMVLLIACENMFIAAFDYCLPIRGATACGEFYVSEDSNLITGKPIIEAYEQERKQDWIGCWITDECLNKVSKVAYQEFINERKIIKYPIPLKSGTVREVYAYNWVTTLFKNKDIVNLDFLETKSFLQKRKSHEWSEERKHKNTKDFISFVLNRNQYS